MDQIQTLREPTVLATSVPMLCYQGALEELLELLHERPGQAVFYKAMLSAIGSNFTIPLGALEVCCQDQVISHTYRDEEQTPSFWERLVSEALTDALADPRPAVRVFEPGQFQLDACIITVPIVDRSGDAIGAMAMAAPCDDTDDAREILRGIQALSRLTSLGSLTPKEQGESAGPEYLPGRALRKVSRFGTAEELAYAITNNLRAKEELDVVALGSVSKNRVRLLSVSGLEDVNENSPAVGAIRAAMEECLDEGDVIFDGPGEEGSGHVLHKQWSENNGGQTVASIPFAADGQLRAILSMRRPPDGRFDGEDVERIRGLVAPYVEGMDLVDRASRGLARHGVEGAREALAEFAAPRRWVRKAVITAAVAAVLWFLFGTRTFEVSTHFVVTPSFVQHISAPFAARIREVGFVAGDDIKSGDILCMLDTAVLELEWSRIEADLAVNEIQEREALAGGDHFAVQLVQRKIASQRAQLDTVKHQIERATIRAPFDGIVLQGDLSERIGDSCTEGEPLFQLSETDAWDLELTVDEEDILYVIEGMKGEFASFARPDDRRAFEVTAIRPAVEQLDGGPGVIVEGRASGTTDWIRPGMEGIARIEIGRRRAWWIALHRGLDYFRVRYWL